MLGRDVEVDPDVYERWVSFCYRRMMGITHEQYLDTPTLSVQWDMALARTESEAQADKDAQGG